jgi:muramidase (phage lysozyme)/peptidoglycan hydrolase-like protein with peptidoglycan-binding domain
MNAATKALLNAIGSKEAPKGYNQIYTPAEKIVGKPKLTDMTLTQIRALQNRMIKGGAASSACGRYQFLRKTLDATRAEMRIAGTAVWTPDLQDRMAVHLMEARGLNQYLKGKMSRETFANNLAKEWASLPVVTPINGKKPGQSYYAGDGLNAALHSPADILRLIDALKAPASPALPVDAAPPPATDPDPLIGPESSPAQIRALQAELALKNYNVGKIDGKWGKLTAGAVLSFKSNNGLSTATLPVRLSVVKAAQVWVIETRQDATVAELRKDGSTTVKGADLAQIAGGTAVTAGVAEQAGLFSKVGEWAEKAGTVRGWLEPFSGIVEWLASNIWLGLGVAGGAAALWFGYRVKQKRLAEYKEAKLQ